MKNYPLILAGILIGILGIWLIWNFWEKFLVVLVGGLGPFLILVGVLTFLVGWFEE